ncbi:MAG: hypothetical protein ACOYUZ_05130 [Patescibacteria group bacterium]
MIKGKVIKIQDNRLHVQLPDGSDLSLPQSVLDSETNPGDTIYLGAAAVSNPEEAPKQLAKNILNTLIND